MKRHHCYDKLRIWVDEMGKAKRSGELHLRASSRIRYGRSVCQVAFPFQLSINDVIRPRLRNRWFTDHSGGKREVLQAIIEY